MIDYVFKDKRKTHRDVSKMLSTIDSDEKVLRVVDLQREQSSPPSHGGVRNVERWMLTEDGLYEVLMRSRKLITKEFKKQVKQILKEIRKNEGYVATYETDTDEMMMARALLIAQKGLKFIDEKLKD